METDTYRLMRLQRPQHPVCADLAVVWLPGAQIGQLISNAMGKVGRQGVVTMEESRTAEDHLYVVEGMQFERGYISPYFVTDPERMVRVPVSPVHN